MYPVDSQIKKNSSLDGHFWLFNDNKSDIGQKIIMKISAWVCLIVVFNFTLAQSIY